MTNLTETRVEAAGLADLLQRLGRDCTPTQFVREFIKNSIEAVQRIENEEKKILIDVNWDYFNQTRRHKISFTDNGDGMTGQEMLKHLNNLSSSGHRNEHENYGVGAKISALTRNHEGVEYESWKEGVGSSILLTYDPDAHVYGVQPQVYQGQRYDFIPIPPDYPKPDFIQDHGTRVTLFGMTKEQDTMLPPDGVRGGRENWIVQYANTRFFELPVGLEIQTRVGYYRDKNNKKHNYTRKIEGQKNILDSNCEARGRVNLSDASLHWWIMKERQDHARQYTSGHTACINEGEVLNILDGRSNKAPGFGIIFGKEDVVLYIEPGSKYMQNTARTLLVREDGAGLPWDRWQDEFRSQMPKELEDFVRRRMAGSVQTSHSDSIRDRLKSVAAFLKISRFRKSGLGTFKADPDSMVSSGVGLSGDSSESSGGRRSGMGNAPGSHRANLLADLIDAGVLAEQASPDKFPEVHWISGEADLEDRAATFIPTSNIVKANSDFQGFTDIIEHFSKQYEGLDGAEEVVADVVKEAFEQQLVEAVAGAMSLKNRPKWSTNDFENAVSEEALTVAVLPRYHVLAFIKRQLSGKLGSHLKAAANG
jgi:hypothetical protein